MCIQPLKCDPDLLRTTGFRFLTKFEHKGRIKNATDTEKKPEVKQYKCNHIVILLKSCMFGGYFLSLLSLVLYHYGHESTRVFIQLNPSNNSDLGEGFIFYFQLYGQLRIQH